MINIKDKKLWIIGILFSVGFFLYAFNLNNALFWDDADWIVNNSFVHSFSWENIKFIFSHDTLAGIGLKSNYYRPFLFLTFMADYIIAGAQPLIYHLTNNLIHIANAVMIFFILDKFLKKRLAAFIAALLFLIHPLQTEAVAYVSGRGDPMSVFFMLAALLLFIKSREIKGTSIYYLGSILSATLAILSRETAFLFPAYLTVFLIAFVHKDRFLTSIRRSISETLPFWGLSLFYGILRLTVLNFQNTLNFFQQSNVYTQHLSYRIYTFLHVILVYMRLIFVPAGLHMERDVLVNSSFFQWPVWLSALLILGLVAWLIYLYRTENPNFRLWFFAWGFFFINLAPTSGIFPINALIYEHWLYFSLFGFFTLAAFYLDKLTQYIKPRRVLFIIFCLLLSAYLVFWGIQTVRRNIIWGDFEKFYLNVLYYEPKNVRVLNNLSNYYSDNGRLKEAEALLRRAINANDLQPAPYYNLGNILRDRNDYTGAVELYKKAISIDPSFHFAYFNIAAIYAQQGQFSLALSYLLELNKIVQRNPAILYNIAQVQAAMGQKDAAIATIKEGLNYSDSRPGNQKQLIDLLTKLQK